MSPMVADLRIGLGSPHAGWMEVELVAGESRFVADASYVIDPILPLVLAGLQAIEGVPINDVLFFEEPVMHLLTARDCGDALVISVRAGQRGEHEEVFVATTTRRDFAWAIWRGLSRLESEVGVGAIVGDWRSDYPAHFVEVLGRALGATRPA